MGVAEIVTAENISLVEKLLNEDNISGIWAVVGAVIALGGILLNNFFENARKRKERRISLIRDAYGSAIEYLALSHGAFIQIVNLDKTFDSFNIGQSEKFYKLFLVASPKVIEAFSQVSAHFERILVKAATKRISIEIIKSEIDGYDSKIKSSLSLMNETNNRMEEYNKNKENLPKYWDFLRSQFSEAQSDFKNIQSELDKAKKEMTQMQLNLFKELIEDSLLSSKYLLDIILVMRKDLERKLNKKDRKKIDMLFHQAGEEARKKMSEFVLSLESQAERLML